MASRVAYAARFFDAICRGAHQAEQGAWGQPALQGTVMGIARGITDQGNRDGPELLSSVNPTFTWARLAQRIPVRIRLTQVPERVLVSAGMTCRVIMKDGMQPHRRQYEISYSNVGFDGRAAMVVQRRLAPGFRGRGGEVHRGRTCWRTRNFHRWCLIEVAMDKKKRVPGDQPIAWPKAEEAGPCARPIARKESWHLRQHRQHRLRPYWAPAGVGASQVDGCRRKRECRTSELLFWVGSGSTIADAADGGDGVFGK